MRDSLGIRIVENRAPAWSEDEAWSIDPEPVLQIGVVEGAGAYQFASIADARRRADGVIGVSEADLNEIRLFDSDGVHLRTIGRKGEGPGEFSSAPILAWVSADTLLAWDAGSRRLTWFDDDGNRMREMSLRDALTGLDIPLARHPGAWELAMDGTLLVAGGRLDATGLRLIRPDGSVASLGSYARGEGALAGMWLVEHSFTPYPYAALRSSPAGALIATIANREITAFDSAGRVTARMRIDVARVPLDDAVLDAEREQWRERAGPEGVDAFNGLSKPDSMPAIRNVHLDMLGNVWVGRRTRPGYADETDFDLLDPDGRWLGTVHVPEEANPIYEIGDDYLLTGWRDDLDVLHVRMYRLIK